MSNNQKETMVLKAQLALDNDDAFIMMAYRHGELDVLCQLNDLTHEQSLAIVSAGLDSLHDIAASLTEVVDQKITNDIDNKLSSALRQLTALSVINPEIEGDLLEVSKLISEATGIDHNG